MADKPQVCGPLFSLMAVHITSDRRTTILRVADRRERIASRLLAAKMCTNSLSVTDLQEGAIYASSNVVLQRLVEISRWIRSQAEWSAQRWR